jgi:hypothetical protein
MKVIDVENGDLTVLELARLAKTGPVILTRRGKPLAAVKDLTRSDWESISLANNPQFRSLIEESRRSFRDEGSIPLEDLRRELDLPAKAKSRRSRKKKT